jgi:hypothetical protein
VSIIPSWTLQPTPTLRQGGEPGRLRINHSVAFSANGACTNQAESYFSRLRRAVVGQHHHVSKQYLHQYANEAAWREDHSRQDNKGQHVAVLGAALASPVSRAWKGYWQRAA